MKCMRVCPTQAIRVRDGVASILEDKCIDCGECLTECPEGAIVALTDPVGELSKFKYTVAIPSPALYAQFGRQILPDEILAGLKDLGFSDTVDLAFLCGEVSFAIQEHLREYEGPKPIVSNACPTVVRLIQVKYPSLVDHISPIDIPRELAAREIKKAKAKEHGLDEREIGAFYITPCPVKMISIKQPAEKEKSYLDGAISITDIYGPLLSAMDGGKRKERSYRKALEDICILGIGWAIVGGICRTLRLKNSLAVSGLTEILEVFDDIERGKMRHIDFAEAYSCWQGCVGGSLTVENRYVSYNKILKLIETLEFEEIKACPDIREVRKRYAQKYFFRTGILEPRPLKPLDTDLARAIQKRKEKQEIFETLPQIDCGACGSPTCLTFAEDVVTGTAELSDCLVMVAQKSAGVSRKPASPPKIVELNPPDAKAKNKKVD
ncbi:MAG: 4Fe-4S binding protein [Candidatus Eiseniibacteriota bacterium]|nr:MAG: 4Fe-4S binding protein [Candidatus Eisenbacteria bacterium]